MSDEYTGDEVVVPGSLIGYRAWKLSPHEPGLRAVIRNVPWEPGLNQASCLDWGYCDRGPGFGARPSRSCSCGFYARYADDLHGYMHGSIPGVIEAHGQIVLGRTGFRAEYARIKALYLDPLSTLSLKERRYWLGCTWADSFPEALHKLSVLYGVPVLNSFAEAIEAFPPSDVSALRPTASSAITSQRQSMEMPYTSFVTITTPEGVSRSFPATNARIVF